jgi:hypothetical protein
MKIEGYSVYFSCGDWIYICGGVQMGRYTLFHLFLSVIGQLFVRFIEFNFRHHFNL